MVKHYSAMFCLSSLLLSSSVCAFNLSTEQIVVKPAAKKTVPITEKRTDTGRTDTDKVVVSTSVDSQPTSSVAKTKSASNTDVSNQPVSFKDSPESKEYLQLQQVISKKTYLKNDEIVTSLTRKIESLQQEIQTTLVTQSGEGQRRNIEMLRNEMKEQLQELKFIISQNIVISGGTNQKNVKKPIKSSLDQGVNLGEDNIRSAPQSKTPAEKKSTSNDFFIDEEMLKERARERADELQKEVKDLILQTSKMANIDLPEQDNPPIIEKATNKPRTDVVTEYSNVTVRQPKPENDVNTLQLINKTDNKAAITSILNLEKSDISALEKAANSGDINANYQLAVAFFMGKDIAKDQVKAVALLQKNAEVNHIESIIFLAYCYENGEGIAKDTAKAFSLYQEAYSKGSIAAQRNIARMLEQGIGTKQDKQKAFLLAKSATQKNDAEAMSLLGHFYENGIVVNKDLQQASYWYQKGAKLNNSNAMTSLAHFYLREEGKKSDYVKGIYWLTEAAKKGSSVAQFNLSVLFGDETGDRKPDYVQAYAWSNIAVKNGIEEATIYMQRYWKKLKPTEQQQARRLADRYISLYYLLDSKNE